MSIKSSGLFPSIAIIGAGAWGSALAIHLARKGQAVRLWAYEKQQVAEINTKKTKVIIRQIPNLIAKKIRCSNLACSRHGNKLILSICIHSLCQACYSK